MRGAIVVSLAFCPCGGGSRERVGVGCTFLLDTKEWSASPPPPVVWREEGMRVWATDNCMPHAMKKVMTATSALSSLVAHSSCAFRMLIAFLEETRLLLRGIDPIHYSVGVTSGNGGMR